ncbi:hypothetical protein PQJ75_11110 [Rhodoplanes sp. TEM]|uniref:Gfo/Idh/MocA-like oxidoreductase N-terminal domain-containing protein n=1 Tax=Rhodoplanes tepidamans TaxID=200616 RepID=A0ABT5JBU1_RHOTP|nr:MULTISPECIES: hypothetical protein [Rhodoplanes]MDC7787155.1 hypothetical protein [Rhodoplanes tepidamans]MDC7984281.1 hypothetical protein [Rhodoplanes sp. TEM]MDQ0356078.1 hypothetical protein [Rhodoplanes tepidamans]
MTRIAPGIAPRFGLIVIGRGDPRLAAATLAATRAWPYPPVRAVLAVPKGREHAFAAVAASAAAAVVAVAEPDLVAAAVAALAGDVDVVIAAPEGVVLDAAWLARLRDHVILFEDSIAGVDLVHQVVKIATDGAAADLAVADRPREPAVLSWLRGLIRARSLLGAVFWARVDTLRQVKLATAGEGGDAVTFLLALDQLRPRGRTTLGFTRHARHVTLLPERRTGFDAGYGLYRRLEQLAEARRAAAAVGAAAASHIDLRLERLRLMTEQTVRSLLGRAGRHNAATFLKGALAARRDALAVRRTMVRDLRELR